MSRWTRMTSTDYQEHAVEQVERWVKKSGLRICGGTTIGKSPQTVILDLEHQDSAIYVDDDGTVKAYGEEVECHRDFQRVVDACNARKVAGRMTGGLDE